MTLAPARLGLNSVPRVPTCNRARYTGQLAYDVHTPAVGVAKRRRSPI